jgi:excisionase family DNA binding protein
LGADDQTSREKLTRVKAELRRRGMSEAEIEAAVRKRKRRRGIEFEVLKTPHLAPHEVNRPGARGGGAGQLCTVEFAADHLKLHPKTVLRFIREGRLKATRIGKSYRIPRGELEALAGAPVQSEPAREEASVTSIVDVPDVDAGLAKSWAKVVGASLKRPTGLRAEVIYEPAREHLKIVLVGPPGESIALLGQIRVWLAQLRR